MGVVAVVPHPSLVELIDSGKAVRHGWFLKAALWPLETQREASEFYWPTGWEILR